MVIINTNCRRRQHPGGVAGVDLVVPMSCGSVGASRAPPASAAAASAVAARPFVRWSR